MQRIKSQSTCLPQDQHTISQSRPRSKKASKGHTPDLSSYAVSKHKQTNAINSQNSMASLKSVVKVSGSSMKNLRIVNHHQMSAKNSVQNTSRGGQNSAISARILKQIVGYSNRGANKVNKQQNEQTNKISLDLDSGLRQQQKCRNSEQKSEVHTNANENNQSQQTSRTKERETRNSSGGMTSKNKYNSKLQHRIVEEFSPMTMSPAKPQQQEECQYQSIKMGKGNRTDGKRPFFNDNSQANSKHQPSQNTNSNQQQTHDLINRYEYNQHSVNVQKWKQYSLVQEVHIKSTESKQHDKPSILEISNQFLQISSPHHRLNQQFKVQCYNDQLFLQPTRGNNQNNAKFNKSRNKIEVVNEIISQNSELLIRKQQLTIVLQECTTMIQSQYQLKYKQLIPLWKGIIQGSSSQMQISRQLQRLNNQYQTIKREQYSKKTELFQVSRDQLSRKKQKQYMSRSNKDKFINEAIAAQEELKLKLSSKADYDHVILFNERVVLTGQAATSQPKLIFTEMFENNLAKKFALIAKKQLPNLSVYDSRLVQQFLKKIQQHQANYSKVDNGQAITHAQSTKSMNAHYNSTEQQQKLQHLIESIQQLTLSLEQLHGSICVKRQQLKRTRHNTQQYYSQIEEYIKNTNEQVSGQYKLMQGHSFDFQTMLHDKYEQEFKMYAKEISRKNQIMFELNQIQKQLRRKSNADKQNHGQIFQIQQSQVTQIFSRVKEQERSKTSRRESSSFGSTPNHKKSCNLQDPDAQKTAHDDTLEIKATSHLSARLKNINKL